MIVGDHASTAEAPTLMLFLWFQCGFSYPCCIDEKDVALKCNSFND
jgi:hypothetical protein